MRAAFLSTAAQSLLRALLEREPGKRLGAGVQGSEAVMAHPFFRPITWARLLRREVFALFSRLWNLCGPMPFLMLPMCHFFFWAHLLLHEVSALVFHLPRHSAPLNVLSHLQELVSYVHMSDIMVGPCPAFALCHAATAVRPA